jgi:alpha-L-rhamnosidase
MVFARAPAIAPVSRGNVWNLFGRAGQNHRQRNTFMYPKLSIVPQLLCCLYWLLVGVVVPSSTVLAVSPYALSVGEGFINPIGFHDPTPVFSWRLPNGVKKQTAYQLETRSGAKQWDSGWVQSERSVFVQYGGAPFSSRDAVQWRVRFRDENGKESNWSDWAHFEVGLLSPEDWSAQWIRPSGERPAGVEAVGWLRRQFSADKKIAKARLHVTARGVFELRINGDRVGRDYFANGWTSYDKRIDVLTYDVTQQLRVGSNTLQAMLGTGWYAGRLPFNAQKMGPYGSDPELLLQLEIVYEDGSRERVVSDGRWEGTFQGPVISSSIYDGESYDARREVTGWTPVVANAQLGSARLQPKPFPPVRAVQTLATRAITEPKPGVYIFDLGQNMVGWARVKLPMEQGQTVTLRFAEMLQRDGTLYNENYRTAKSIDTYTAAESGTIEWEPHFTFHGFRYVEITGVPEGVKPKNDWVTGVVLQSDLPTIGTFESSHPKLNQLQSNIVWGWRGNSLDIPTDCPQRDERAGWTGDAQVFCPTAMFNTDSHAFWKSWLGSMRDDQEPDGVIPDFVPSANLRWRAKSPGWMDAATFIPWEVYVRTGDLDVLAENYEMMTKLVAWYRSQSADGLLPNIKGYGDWLQPYPNARATQEDRNGDRRGDTPTPLLGTAFYARSAQILADTARVLQRQEDVERFAAEAATVKQSFYRHYFDAAGKLQNAPETQTAYVLALAFDLVPAASRSRVAGHLVRLVQEAGGHLRTGFLGTPHIVPVLDQAGHRELAYALLFRETYPSWFYSINQGATTMWERWNSYTHESGFGDVSMNSFNHYAYGAIGQWMYERVAGLAPDPEQPGYKHFFVRPLIGGPLEAARAELMTPYGKAVSGWKKQNGRAVLEVVVPPNTTATLVYPVKTRAPQKLEPGEHRFEVELGEEGQRTAGL